MVQLHAHLLELLRVPGMVLVRIVAGKVCARDIGNALGFDAD